MTIEHSIIAGVDDIKALIFECRQCRTRVSMSPPSEIRIPPTCPNGNCAAVWIAGQPAKVASDYDGSTSAYVNLVRSIGYLRRKNNGSNFRILLEFEESATDDRNATT